MTKPSDVQLLPDECVVISVHLMKNRKEKKSILIFALAISLVFALNGETILSLPLKSTSHVNKVGLLWVSP